MRDGIHIGDDDRVQSAEYGRTMVRMQGGKRLGCSNMGGWLISPIFHSGRNDIGDLDSKKNPRHPFRPEILFSTDIPAGIYTMLRDGL